MLRGRSWPRNWERLAEDLGKVNKGGGNDIMNIFSDIFGTNPFGD